MSTNMAATPLESTDTSGSTMAAVAAAAAALKMAAGACPLPSVIARLNKDAGKFKQHTYVDKRKDVPRRKAQGTAIC